MTTQPQIDGRDLGLAFQATTVLRDRVLAKHGRTFAEFVAIRVLSEGTFDGRDAYVSTLARNLQLDAAQVEALLAALDAAGLVQDGTIVELTPAGEAAFTNLTRAFQHTTAQIYAGIDAADIATTRNVLQRVQAQAERLAATR